MKTVEFGMSSIFEIEIHVLSKLLSRYWSEQKSFSKQERGRNFISLNERKKQNFFYVNVDEKVFGSTGTKFQSTFKILKLGEDFYFIT